MEIGIAVVSLGLSLIGGGAGGVASIVKLSRHLDRRFDDTDRKIQDLTHRYDVRAATEAAKVELLDYRLSQSEQTIKHKFERCENAIYQLSKFLEKSQGYCPSSVFPLNSSDDD